MGNSLKSIFARITTNSTAIGALEAIGISLEDAGGEAKTASQLIGEVAGKWDGLSDSQRRNTAVSVGGLYQLTRFNALIQNYDTAIEATTTSLNSYGSAAREQEAYNQSLEARINRLQTAWYGFSDAVGNSILYDSLVVGTSLLEGFTKAGDSVVGVNIGFSAVVGVISTGLLGLSARFTGFTSAVVANTLAQVSNRVAATSLIGRFAALGVSATVAGTAIRAALAATGIGLAITAITVGLTALVNKFSDIKQSSEEFETYMEKNRLALTDNRVEVDRLLASYSSLQAKNKEGILDTEEQVEYVSVQNKLAELFPALVKSVDARGNAHLKSATAIDAEIAATQKLIDAERELAIAQAEDNFGDLNKDADKLRKSRDRIAKNLADYDLSDTGIASLQLDIAKLDKEIADKSAEIRSNVLVIAEAFTDASASINESVSQELVSSLDQLDFDNLDGTQLKAFAKDFAELRVQLSAAFDGNNEEEVTRLNGELDKLYATTNNFNPALTGLVVDFKKLKDTANIQAEFAIADKSLGEVGDTAEGLAKKLADLTEAIIGLSSVEEQLAGVNQAQVDSSQELTFLYDTLTSRLGGLSEAELQSLVNKKNLTSEERAVVATLKQRDDVLQQLAVIYPELASLEENSISLSADKVLAIKKEEAANKALLEGYKLASEGKLTAEQTATLNQASGTKARISNIKSEILALNALIKQYEDTANAALTSQEFIDKVNDGSLLSSNSSVFIPGVSEKQVKNKVAGLELELSTANGTLEGLVNSINTTIDSVGTKSSKTAKATKSDTEKSIYVTDTYKLAVEALNVAIAKQQKLQGDYTPYSAKYRSALQAEIKLQKEKLTLIQNQTNALDKQIKSGKIAQTGNVTVAKATTSAVKAGSVAVSGFQGRISSPQGYRTNPVTGLRQYHEGIDIPNPRGTRVDTPFDGKVTATGYNSVSGNFVKVLDSSGASNFFGHLDTIVTKLGAVITAGTQIGTVGTTGRSTGNHLHYQVSRDGKLLDAASYVAQARTGTVTTNGGTTTTGGADTSSTVVKTQQAIDDAKSTLSGLQQDILNQQEAIAALEKQVIDSNLAYFEYKKNTLDKDYSLQVARLASVDRADAKYNKILDYQVTLLEKKRNYNQDEIQYINELIRKGGLSEVVLDELKGRLVESETALRGINSEIQKFKLDNIVSAYDNLITVSEQLVTIENSRLDVLNQKSPQYRKSLEDINKSYTNQKKATEDYITSLTNLIRVEKLNGVALEEASTKIKEARSQLIQLSNQISNGNYEIIVNVQTNFNEIDDDLNFEIERERAFRESYVEGSANYQESINKEIDLINKQAELKLELYNAQEKELKTLKLTAEDYKKVTESLEDTELQYYALINSVKALQKQSDDASKQQRTKIADDAIAALKDYYSQRQEETDKAYAEELKSAEKRHKLIVDQLNEERDLFRRNVEERLELIDRTESERSYNMEINELEAQRNQLQDLYNTYEIDTSREATKRRKELGKQIEDIDKNIAEKRHARDIELQKQGLNDLLESKEEEVDGQLELEDERYNAVVESIDKERAYWNQYFTDLLNDQRKFNKIREDIINGSFESILNEFEGYATELEGTLHTLENTLDGTMQAVGTAIRQNVIDNLREAIKLVNDYTTAQDVSSSINTDTAISSPRDPNVGKDSLQEFTEFSPNEPTRNLTNPDYKVLMAKYFRENLVKANGVNANTVTALKAKGDSLAQQGRNEGSIIRPDETLASALTTLSPQQKTDFKAYVDTNAGKYLTQQNLVDNIKNWAARLETGGYMNFSGNGIDGKGGKAIIAHPNEIILDAADTKSFFSGIKVNEGITNTLAGMVNSFLGVASSAINNASPTSTGDNIFQVTGDIYTESKDSAVNFFNQVGDLIRTQNGGWSL